MDESFRAFVGRNRELIKTFGGLLHESYGRTSFRTHLDSLFPDGKAKCLWIAVGLEYSYPIVTVYDYQQLLATYWLAVAIEEVYGARGQVGVLFVCSDIAEVNRYNINYAFRDYYRRSGDLGKVIADLKIEEDFASSIIEKHDLYFTLKDFQILERTVSDLRDREAYLEFIKRIKKATLQELAPFDSDDFWERVAFVDFPLSALRTWGAKPLGDLVSSIHLEELKGNLGPLHQYRAALGKPASLRNVVRSDPFSAFCPECGNGSLRIIESHFYRDSRCIKYHCLGHQRTLHKEFTNGTSDEISGCGAVYWLGTEEDTYYLDHAGNPLGYPRFGLACVVLDCSIWIMESTQVVNEAFLRNMLALRRSYRAGLLSRKEEPVADCFICCCETTNCGVPADASIFFVGDAGMKAIQRELTLHQFGP